PPELADWRAGAWTNPFRGVARPGWGSYDGSPSAGQLGGEVPMNAPTDKSSSARLSQASTSASTQGTAPAVGTAGAAVPAGQPPPAGAPDVGALIRRVFAHWPVIVVAMALGAVITSQVVRVRKATYKSETVIVYREGIARSVGGGNDQGESLRTL